MAGKRSRNKRQTRSSITGVKFKVQNPHIRRHGPKPKRQVYAEAIERVLNGGWGDQWLTSSEIAYMANETISNHWTQLNAFSVGAIMRKYEKSGHVNSRKKGQTATKRWKRIEKI